MPSLARLSIRAKAPLAAAVLIFLVGAVISTAAFIVVRRTRQEIAQSRLTSLVAQFRVTFRTSLTSARVRAASAARRSEVQNYLASRSPGLKTAAREAIRPTGLPSDPGSWAELIDEQGQVLVTTGPAPQDAVVRHLSLARDELTEAARALQASGEPDAGWFGKLRADGDAIFYPLVVRAAGDRPVFSVNWRRISDGATTRRQVSELLGSEAALFFWNADGSLWTDWGRPAAEPRGSVKLDDVAMLNRPGVGDVLAAGARIEGTPWAFTIEFPQRVIQAPAWAFLRRVTVVAIVCIGIGVAAAWVLGRRITGPIHTLTVAADAIAAGDTARRVEVHRQDELGRLAASFNAMAAEIHESHRHLKETVATRTGELREAKESLARRDKLALIGQLAGGIGHEIRNPLGVMSSAVQCLEKILPEGPSQAREQLAILRQQVQLSAKIVNDLLDVSRTTPASRERVTVASLVDERLKRASLHGARLETDVPHDLPPVHVDPVHAGQVLDNLVTNAVQAMDGTPGTVRVRARDTGDGFIRVEVSDTGPGIPREHVGKIFEPLFSTKTRGYGLGLALSKSLAQANGGDLSLVSEPGHGATFAFVLPVADKRA